LTISSTVIPLGWDLSSGPSCARAIWGVRMTASVMIGNSMPNTVARENKGNVKNAGRDWNLINPILTKREHRKVNGSPHPPEPPCIRLFRGGGRLRFCLLHLMRLTSEGEPNLLFFTFAFRIALAMPHSTNPGNNWYSLITGITLQGTTTSRFLLRYPR